GPRVVAVDQRVERHDTGAGSIGDGQRTRIAGDEPQRRVEAAGVRHRALGEIDADDTRAEVGQEAADVTGRSTANVEDRSGPAGHREATQPIDVPRLARQLVREVAGVLLGDAVEGRADGVDHDALV